LAVLAWRHQADGGEIALQPLQEPDSVRQSDVLGQPPRRFDSRACDVNPSDLTAAAPGEKAGRPPQARAEIENDALLADVCTLGKSFNGFDSAVVILVELEQILWREIGWAFVLLGERPNDLPLTQRVALVEADDRLVRHRTIGSLPHLREASRPCSSSRSR
jgi:hypothetical protein